MMERQRKLGWLLLGFGVAVPSVADIVTDGSVGPAQQLRGPDFMIPDTLGSQRGSNLFHSFSQFNIDSAESATFTTSFAGPTDNVISRITGAMPSTINGRLASTIPGAQLWLINPRGVLFGSESSLDLQGSLHVATASYVALQDGGRFGADLSDPANTLLTTAPVAAFGFLAAPEPVAAVGQLELAAGHTLTIAAGDIGVSGQLEVPSGRINMVALGSSGELAISPEGVIDSASVDAFASLGDVDIQSRNSELARVRSGGDSPGSIYIRGNTFLLDGFVSSSAHDVDSPGAKIDVAAREGIAIGTRSSEAFLVTGALGSARAADLHVAAPDIEITENGFVTAFVDTEARGDGGDLHVSADRLSVSGALSTATNGSGDAGNVSIAGYSSANAEFVAVAGEFASVSADSGAFSTPADGDAGDISVRTRTLLVDSNNGGIFADTQSARAGTLTLHVDELLIRQGTVSASVGAEGSGEAGAVNVLGLGSTQDSVNAASIVSIVRGNGAAVQGSRAPATITSAGGAGSIRVSADRLQLRDGGVISISNFEQAGEGGAITLNVDYLDVGAVDGGSGDLPSLITSATSATGNAGDIVIRGVGSSDAEVVPSQRITLSDPFGGLRADSFSADPGAGASGNISLFTRDMVIQNGAGISSSNAGGDPGVVTLNVDALTVADSSEITTLTLGTASAGDIRIRGLGSSDAVPLPAREVLITGGSTIGGNPLGDAGGAGGTITVRSNSLMVSDGARVDVGGFSSTSAGGDINLLVDSLELNGGQVLADSTGGGVAGSILIAGSGHSADAPKPAQRILLLNSARLLSSATGTGRDAGTAGDVSVFGESIAVSGGSEILATTADGTGGSVSIEAGTLEVSEAGRVATSTVGLADGGDLTLRVDELRLESGSIEATSDPNIGRFVFYQRFVQAPDASLSSVLEPGGVIFASIPPGELGAPDNPFLFFVELAPSEAAVLWATNLELKDVPANTTSVAPGVAEIRGASDGSIPIQLLITGITDTEFSGEHNEAGALDINLQFLEAGNYEFGDGGKISILGRTAPQASAVDLSGSGRISSASLGRVQSIAPAGDALPGLVFHVIPGGAGEIAIASDSLSLTDAALISAGTVDGAGGSVLLNAETVSLAGASLVGASSTGAGNAGSVILRGSGGAATQTLIDGARLESQSSGAGDAGSVVIDSERLTLSQGAELSVLSQGTGSAGSVNISGTDLALTSGSTILASVADNAGGSINVDVDGMVSLSDSTMAASAQGLAAGDSGGNIRISAPGSVSLNGSQLRADADAGAGGNIDIDTRTIVVSADSQISASSQSNVDGQIEIDAVNQITGTLLNTEAPELAQPAPLRQRCTPRDLEERSSLVLQSAPADAVRSPYLDGRGSETRVGSCRTDSP
ncbi:MAG: filamentous hemagglutinin N-terminal domain-containing protein [Pseudomonadota bacterium]